MSKSNYGAENITVLEGLEAVRKRPGMYIGNTGKDGLHRCLGEILDNSVDEFMAGHATVLKVVLKKDGSVLVSDDGRGIPTDIHPKTGKSTLETILTVLHAGGKFDQDSYQFSGGLHGVGASVVNALSDMLEVWVNREDNIHYMSFSKGKPNNELIKFEKELLAGKHPEIVEHILGDKTGTVISFRPDYEIFEEVSFDVDEIKQSLKQMAYLNKGLKIVFVAEKESIEEEFCYPLGILTYLEDLTEKETLITPIIHFERKLKNFELEMAIAYGSDSREKLFPFTNGIINPEGGMHVTGLKTAITALINNYAQQKGFFKKMKNLLVMIFVKVLGLYY
ncbi:DNA topoisomerase IV subunit B, partial [Candidatus Gracilibacteria bacterium]|nr:DNA topoisomerase IV subunit B [Candidatus Gracilibacteria bacterium]